MGYKVAFLATMTVFAGSASAVTFSFVTIQAPPLSTGSSYQAIGNSISFFLPNAIVGDAVAPLRAGNLTIEYDADTPAPAMGAEVGINLGVALSGSGTVFFNERIYELDGLGNEIGLIGQVSHTFVPNGATSWSGNINFSRTVERFRAKKYFELAAFDTADFDLASIGVVNQNVQVVPEPATMAAVGLGVAALIRRRKRA